MKSISWIIIPLWFLSLTTLFAGAPDTQALLDPAKASQEAPTRFIAHFKTTKGDFKVEILRNWAPLGADRFYSLVAAGYFQDIALFRVIPGFMAQFGFHNDLAVNQAWKEATIDDDPVTQSNLRGTMSFASRGADTRTTQLFINFSDNVRLDTMGFAPIGRVIEGMEVVDSFYGGYGEGAPRGSGPSQSIMWQQGGEYLKSQFPELDRILSITIEVPATE